MKFLCILFFVCCVDLVNIMIINLISLASLTSVSTENLSSTTTTKLQRAPSLPRSYNRNRSGIPVVHKDPPPPKGVNYIYYMLGLQRGFNYLDGLFV